MLISLLLSFVKKILISNSFIIRYSVKLSKYDIYILLKTILPLSSKRKLLIFNKKEVFKYLIFNFKLFMVTLNPFNAWDIKLSMRESKNDFDCSFFFILSKANLIKASIKLFLSFNKIFFI